jgi:hypothetical protein
MTKEIKLTEEVKNQMLLLQPMSRAGFTLRQLDNGEAEKVQVAMAQSVLDQPTIEKATGKKLVKLAEQKRKEYTKILSPCIVDWERYYEPRDDDSLEADKIEYDLSHIKNIREDILLDIFSEACAITGIVLR